MIANLVDCMGKVTFLYPATDLLKGGVITHFLNASPPFILQTYFSIQIFYISQNLHLIVFERFAQLELNVLV